MSEKQPRKDGKGGGKKKDKDSSSPEGKRLLCWGVGKCQGFRWEAPLLSRFQ